MKNTKPKTPRPDVKPISEKQLIDHALNTPMDTFQLGDRTFNIQDLSYDDYLEFTQFLSPFIDGIASRLVGSRLGISIPGVNLGPALTASAVMNMCSKELPQMAQIVCRQTEPDITVEEIKTLAKKPTPLVGLVVAQVRHNGILSDLSAFFAQLTMILPSQK